MTVRYKNMKKFLRNEILETNLNSIEPIFVSRKINPYNRGRKSVSPSRHIPECRFRELRS